MALESLLLQIDGLKLLLQVFLTLILIAFILRKRSSLAAEPRLRFLAERPFSAGIFAGFSTVLDSLRRTLSAHGVLSWGPSSVSLSSGLPVPSSKPSGGSGWFPRWLCFLYLHELFQFFALPLPLFRGYVFFVALIGLCLCGWRALRSPREGETRFTGGP